MKTGKSIVYLGYSSFPHGLAEVQKMILISKSLILAGNRVLVICRNGTHDREKYPELKNHGVYENIEYIYASGSAFRNKNFFQRRLFEIKGRINEALLLRKMSKSHNLDYAILSTRSFSSIFLYSVLSNLFRFKTILNYVEYYSALKKGGFEVGTRLNDKLFDKYAPSLTHAIFPISEFLVEHIKKTAPGKKYLKIPVLTDFEKYKDTDGRESQTYFLFCGDVAYREVIEFIIDSFGQLRNSSHFLYLVIGGNKSSIAEIEKYIAQSDGRDKIKLFSRLPERELYTFYKNAAALLIPLRPTFQDIARFPHKTGEYLASGNPVISTNYGEIKYYFRDKETMLVADEYDKNLFAQKMQFVIDNPDDAKAIGLRGKNLACQFFDYRTSSKTINEFLINTKF